MTRTEFRVVLILAGVVFIGVGFDLVPRVALLIAGLALLAFSVRTLTRGSAS